MSEIMKMRTMTDLLLEAVKTMETRAEAAKVAAVRDRMIQKQMDWNGNWQNR